MASVSVSGRVAPWQRFTRARPCPICGSYDGAKHDCWGYLSEDGRIAFCSRHEFAGALQMHPTAQAYGHLLNGACRCGVEHGPAPISIDRATAPAKITRAHHRADPTAVYAYANGLRKLRYEDGKGKRFVWQRSDGAGDWLDGRDGQEPGLYGADALASADPFAAVWIPEGEKCANALTSRGLLAVTPPDGAGSWRDEYAAALAGRQVIILADADETGRAHAQEVAHSIAGVALTVRVVELDGAHDVADWLDAGGTLDELRRIAAAATPIAARMPQSQERREVLQDGRADACPHCRRWQTRATEAEERLHTVLRQQTAIAHAMRNPALSAPLKVAYFATRTVLANKPERDERGMTRTSCKEIGALYGAATKTVSAHLSKLRKLGTVKHDAPKVAAVLDDNGDVKEPEHYELWLGETELFDKPENIPPPERENTWGGARQRPMRQVSVPESCGECGSVNVTIRAELVCLEPECGHVEPLNLNRKTESRPFNSQVLQDERPDDWAPLPQDGMPDTPPPLAGIWGHLEEPDTQAAPAVDPWAHLLDGLAMAPAPTCEHPPRAVFTLKSGRTACGLCNATLMYPPAPDDARHLND